MRPFYCLFIVYLTVTVVQTSGQIIFNEGVWAVRFAFAWIPFKPISGPLGKILTALRPVAQEGRGVIRALWPPGSQ